MEKSRTTTVYNGDRTTTLPPPGGIATSARVTDPLGRTTELDQYSLRPGAGRPGGHVHRDLAHHRRHHGGHQVRLRPARQPEHRRPTPATSTWTSTFNLLGQVISQDRPGRRYQHDQLRRQRQSHRVHRLAARKTVSYTYDALEPQNRRVRRHRRRPDRREPAREVGVRQLRQRRAGMKYPLGHARPADRLLGRRRVHAAAEELHHLRRVTRARPCTIPAGEGLPAATNYPIQHTYSTNTGLLLRDVYPAAGGLPAETVATRLRRRTRPSRRASAARWPTTPTTPSTTPTAGSPRKCSAPPHGAQAAITNQWDTALRPAHRPTRHPRQHRHPDQRRRAGLHLQPGRQHHPAGPPPDSAASHADRDPVLQLRRTRAAQHGLDRHRCLRRHSHHRQPRHRRRQPRHQLGVLDHVDVQDPLGRRERRSSTPSPAARPATPPPATPTTATAPASRTR